METEPMVESTSTSAHTSLRDLQNPYMSQDLLQKLAHVIMEPGKFQNLYSESANWRPS